MPGHILFYGTHSIICGEPQFDAVLRLFALKNLPYNCLYRHGLMQ